MLAHEAVQRNVGVLTARGVQFVEPGDGYLACGWIGKGRLAEPADIVAAAERVVAPRASSSPPDRPAKTSTPYGTWATAPAAAWDLRSPRKRDAAGAA
jgi:phosphopantothenoylcysteine synthetase/decarboxylase